MLSQAKEQFLWCVYSKIVSRIAQHACRMAKRMIAILAHLEPAFVHHEYIDFSRKVKKMLLTAIGTNDTIAVARSGSCSILCNTLTSIKQAR
jgi:hypothetical protein